MSQLDSDQSSQLSRKINLLLDRLQKASTEVLTEFTTEELVEIQDLFGHSFVYDIYRDVNELLSLPRGSQRIH